MHKANTPQRRDGRDRARSVATVEAASGQPVRFEKYFHHPSPLGRLRDVLRARREAGILRHLALAGARVPRVLAVEKRADAWVVSMELISGARDLASFLADNPNGNLLACVARDLGRQLAFLHAAGIDHPDLHGGNVLVDEAGLVWLIDFHSAQRHRWRRPPVLRDLLFAESFLRERMSPGLRLRALIAHRRGCTFQLPKRRSGETSREQLAREFRELAEDLTAQAPAARRKEVHRGAGRWLRESGLMERVPVEHQENQEPASLGALRNRKLGNPGALKPGFDRILLVQQAASLETAWSRAARAHDHALPVVTPWELQLSGANPYALFHVCKELAQDGRELRRLLIDRGLSPEDYSFFSVKGGGFLLTPGDPSEFGSDSGGS